MVHLLDWANKIGKTRMLWECGSLKRIKWTQLIQKCTRLAKENAYQRSEKNERNKNPKLTENHRPSKKT